MVDPKEIEWARSWPITKYLTICFKGIAKTSLSMSMYETTLDVWHWEFNPKPHY
jgi:hypothetical protein